MNRKDLLWFLLLEQIAWIWAGLVFSTLESRFMAGMLAGGYFILSAAYMLFRVTLWKDKWRSATLYPLIVHLFGISIPMVLTRVLTADRPFEQVHILGLQGPQFHRLSGLVFVCLIAATVADLARIGLHERAAQNHLK